MRRRRRSSGARTPRLLIAAIVLGGLAAAAELAVRVARPQILAPAYAAADQDLGRALLPSVHVRDAAGGGWIDTNAQTLRQPDDRDPSRRSVAVYGGAATFGDGIDYPETYVARIKAALETGRPDLQLLNAAAPGYGSGHVRKLMERQLASLRPSALVYFLGETDLAANIAADGGARVTTFARRDDGTVELTDIRPIPRWKELLANRTPLGWLGRHSHLFVMAKAMLKRDQVPVPTDESAEMAVTVTTAHLDRIADLAAKADLPLLVVWLPSPGETTNSPSPGRSALADLARQRGDFTFIDPGSDTPAAPNWAGRADGQAWFAERITPAVGDFVEKAVPRQSPTTPDPS